MIAEKLIIILGNGLSRQSEWVSEWGGGERRGRMKKRDFWWLKTMEEKISTRPHFPQVLYNFVNCLSLICNRKISKPKKISLVYSGRSVSRLLELQEDGGLEVLCWRKLFEILVWGGGIPLNMGARGSLLWFVVFLNHQFNSKRGKRIWSMIGRENLPENWVCFQIHHL